MPVILHYVIKFGALHGVGKLRRHFAAGVIGALENRRVDHSAHEWLDRVMQLVPVYHPNRAVIIQQIQRDGHDRRVKSSCSSQLGAAAGDGVMPASLRKPRWPNTRRTELAIEGLDGIDACTNRPR